MFGQCPKCGSADLVRNGYRTSEKDGSQKQRYKCRVCGHRTSNPRSPAKSTEYVRGVPDSKRYVITAAQNATPAHVPFLKALKKYCEFYDAELIVVPFRYQNPTSIWSAQDRDNDYWVPEVVPYLYDGRQELNSNLMLLGDIKVIPTAVRPLTGFESITKDKSAIIAHTKIQFRTVATPQNKLPKILTTTGACTAMNYTDSKAGKKGEHHHIIGACVVEVQDEHVFHLRQINAEEDGTFYDLDKRVTPDGVGVSEGNSIAALVLGDTHVEFTDPGVQEATFDSKDSIVETLKPEYLVWHDLLDFYSGSHHHQRKPFTKLSKTLAGKDRVADEVRQACEYVNSKSPAWCKNVLVPSNHNDHLRRWIEEVDWRKDPVNAEFYLETALHMVRGTRMGDSGTITPHPFHYWAKRWLDCLERTYLLKRDQSFVVAGIELGMHGDLGPNGARGSIRNLSPIGVKSVIGHSHSPGIDGGCYQVGTSSRLNLEYNRGASSWLTTHGVVYKNGKRTLLSIIGRDWRV